MVASGEFLIDKIEPFEDTLEHIPQRQAQVVKNQKQELKDEAKYEIENQINPFEHIHQQPF